MAAAKLLSNFKYTLSRLSLPKTTSVAVAVLGGSDSLALTYLAKQVFDRVVGITVDYRIRPESKEESLKVKESVLALGAEHKLVTLKWPDGIPPKEKIQVICRDRRDDALATVCHRENINLLLFGHQWNDQIETVFLYMACSGGINGLSGMLPVTSLKSTPSVTVCRPLLDVKRESLKELCMEEGLQWIENPNNSQPLYWRNVFRQFLTEYPELNEGLYAIGTTCAAAKHKINREVIQALQDVYINEIYGYATIKRSHLYSLSHPVALQLLHTLINYVSGNYRPFYSHKLNTVYDEMQNANFKCSLHRLCNVFAIDKNTVGVACAMERRDTPSQPIQIGETIHWKNRFLLTLSPLSGTTPPANTTFHIRTMKHNDGSIFYRGIRKVRSSILPPIHSRGGLPVIFDNGTGHVVLIPHFKVNDTSYGVKCSLKLKWPRSLKECVYGLEDSA